MKYFSVVIFALLSICAFTASAQSHNITFGTIGTRDVLLDREIVVKKYKLLLVTSEDFSYPRSNFYNEYNITAIRCIDQYTNGNGGYATLKKGGPGKKDVTVHLKSQRNHGFNFIVEVYGR